MNRISAPLLVVFALVSASVLHTCGTLRADEQSPTTQTSGQGERPVGQGESPAEEGERQRGDRCPFAPEADDDAPASPREGATKPAPSKPRITIGHETTFIEGPLTEDGYVDYLAALNERLSEGVTPENNAAVLLWRCWGPRHVPEKHRKAFFAAMGMDPVPADGDYFVGIAKFFDLAGEDAADEFRSDELTKKRYQDYGAASRGPWKRDQFPLIAAWLDANETPMALAAEASKRKRYFTPVMPDSSPLLLEALLTSFPRDAGQVAQSLRARAMLRLGEGEPDAAWNDILTIHRLGRLVTQGPGVLDGLIGATICEMACSASNCLAHRANLSGDQARKLETELRELPPMASLADKYDWSERLTVLDTMTALARHRIDINDLSGTIGTENGLFLNILDRFFVAFIDWNAALRVTNGWFDRTVAAARLPTFDERRTAMSALEAELDALAERAASPARWYLHAIASGQDLRKAAGRDLADTSLSMMMPALTAGQRIEDRHLAELDLSRLALAIAGYKADHGEFPATLDVVAPKFIPEVPLDRYTDKPLVYKETDDGYLLYALGPNLKDDGGTSLDDDRVNYDIVVRMPARE